MDLPGTSALVSPHHQISHIPPLSHFPNFTTSNLSHLRTYSLPPLNSVTLTSMLYAFISASITLHDCTPHITPLSPFPNFTTSNLPTLYTISVYLHFELPNKTIPFPFRSYPLSLNVLFSFSLIFAPSASLWALLPTTYTYPVPLLYVYRHLFIRITSPICTDIVSRVYGHLQLFVRTFSGRGT